MTKQRLAVDFTSRGRNGWFQAKAIEVHQSSNTIFLDVYSKRHTYPGPIHMEMTPTEAQALGQALLNAASDLPKRTLRWSTRDKELIEAIRVACSDLTPDKGI